MQYFPSNSQKAKAPDAPREKVQPVTSAKAGSGKKSGLGRRFKETFFGGSGRGAAEFAVEDVIVPGIRDMFFQAFQSGLEFLFYGDHSTGGGRRRTTASPITNQGLGHVAYDAVVKPTRASQQTTRHLSRQARATHNLQELVIPTLQEANEVLDRMFDILSASGDVTVADLYVLVDVRPEHTDNKWGWYNLKGAKAVRVPRRGGYLLDLPEPVPLG